MEEDMDSRGENVEHTVSNNDGTLKDTVMSSETILRTTIQGGTSPEELQKAVRALSLKAQDVKTQIYASICKEYTQFFSTVGTSSGQNERLRDLLRDMDMISKQLEHELTPGIDKASASYKELKREYILTGNIAETLQRLFQIQGNLEKIPKLVEIQDFSSAAICINEISEHLTSLSAGTCETKVFKAVREEYRMQKTMLPCRLEECWDGVIKWKIPTSVSWSKIETHLNSSLNIIDKGSVVCAQKCRIESGAYGSRMLKGKGDLANMMNAMNILGTLDSRLKTFGKKLLTYLLKPVIIFQGYHYKEQQLKENRLTKQPVFAKIVTILQYIDKLLSAPLKEQGDEVKVNTMQRIGVGLWSDLSDLIIAECLAKAVPAAGAQLDSYNQTIESTVKFEQYLQEIGLIRKDTHDLLLYVKDINTHFANRKVSCCLRKDYYVSHINYHPSVSAVVGREKCQDLLFEARRLMTSDIHCMTKFERQKDRAVIPVQIAPDVNEKMPSELKRLLLGLTEIPKELLGAKTLLFPECHISESIKKLVDITYKSLMEATESHQTVAVQIFNSVRNIFELYIHVVPTYHKENLKLPQIAALHYNNSMYLAHQCMTLGHQFKNFLPDTLKQSGATFADLIPDLKRVGRQFLFDQQKIQRRNLLDILDNCDGFADCSTKSGVIERALKQVVHQLVHISKLWKDVLPENIYFKCLGLLFSSVLEEIISRILQIEHFSADEASLLHSHLTFLIDKAADIFNPKSLGEADLDMGFIVHVHNWQKYKELVGLLDASLQEIVDRWASGKGPLAEVFDANDVRILIRAIFQNTDRRASALANIKNAKET